MRKGRYKLVEWYEKSVFGEDEAFEVYDLVDDPAEQKNLASSKPALVKSMPLFRQRYNLLVIIVAEIVSK